MSVKLEVPMSALSDAAVARALAQLFEALGGISGAEYAEPARTRSRAAEPPRAAEPTRERERERPARQTGQAAETRYERFLEVLPERSRQFLEMVRSRGLITIDEAMRELDVDVGKAMGGITGSIARWAPEHDVSVPFEAVKGPDGKRAWRWIGLDVRPAPPVPVRSRRRRSRRATGRAGGGQASEAAQRGRGTGFEERLAALKGSLSGDSRRFLSLVEERGEIGQTEVLRHFGLARAQGLRRITQPVMAEAERHGLGDLVETVVSPTGERAWRWAGAPRAVQPAAPGGREAGQRQQAGGARPGVQVRRRGAARR